MSFREDPGTLRSLKGDRLEPNETGVKHGM